ncbi:MAG TPA: hypothetical protein VFV37_03205 [Luteibaculaceae bacterium]|nr:hypothetical protein [Luteibaculaceae bacterium]
MRSLVLFFAVVALVSMSGASAYAATGPQTEPAESFKYDVNTSGAANLSMFKLFTITPGKKVAPNKTNKPPLNKAESDKKASLVEPESNPRIIR